MGLIIKNHVTVVSFLDYAGTAAARRDTMCGNAVRIRQRASKGNSVSWCRLGPILAVAATVLCGGCGTASENTGAPTSPVWTPMPEVNYLSDFPVADKMSEKAAAELQVTHLRETLRLLPAELSFALSDHWDGFELGPNYRGSCLLHESGPDAPLKIGTTYVVTGAIRSPHSYLPDFRTAWQQLGWPVTYDERINPRIMKSTTPDHFTIVAEIADNGDFGVDITSPCFPSAAQGNAAPTPHSIPHP
ncbi:hypothetical protein [Nocardia pseudobrasiliensis]|uniref:hypothetical protein n=1 Tax=Nocardia pseudobrasiliensis TaxID=45979 RepID=UPI0011C07C80|nr:hypothetical protein [Nocardia pseudobrasiliensis]